MPRSLPFLALIVLAPALHAQGAGPVQNTVTFLTPADAVQGGGAYPLAVGGTGSDRIIAVAIGPAGSTYVVGDFTGTFDFDPGPATVPATSQGGNDLFVASYAPDGAFRFGYVVGSALNESGTGVAIANGVAYVGGNFNGTVNFGAPAGTITSQGDLDGFVLAINGTTGALVWASSFGGPQADGNPNLTAGGGRVFAVARFIGPADFDDGPGAAILNSVDSYDVALASFAASTGAYQWSRVIFGGTGQQFEGGADVGDGTVVYAAANSSSNRNGLVGAYGATDGAVVFETPVADASPYDVETSGSRLVVAGASQPASGGSDLFLAAYEPSGVLAWARAFGGIGFDQATGVDFVGPDVFVGGHFEGTVDFDPGAGTAERTSAGGSDAFVARYALGNGAFLSAETFGSTGTDQVLDVDGGTTSGPVAGFFQGTVGLNPSPGQTEPRTASGPSDGFVSLYTPGATPDEPGPGMRPLTLDASPNPAFGTTTLHLTLDRAQAVTVAVFDALGRQVAVLHHGELAAGEHALRLDSGRLSAGVYLVRAAGETAVQTERVTVVR
ncbi:MAG TPA: T9SS type A sorting domain-containing protein [Rubricoccaceae bacterium]|jgi:hypothetical protein